MARTEISAPSPTSEDVFFMDHRQKMEGIEKVSFSEKIVKNQVEVRGEIRRECVREHEILVK